MYRPNPNFLEAVNTSLGCVRDTVVINARPDNPDNARIIISRNDPWNPIVEVGGIDLVDMMLRLESLETTVGRINDRLEQLWYAPGMPGMIEAHEDFNRLIDEQRKPSLERHVTYADTSSLDCVD